MRKIEMVDLKSQYNNIKKDIDEAIDQVIKSGVFIKGETVNKFQANLEHFLNVKNVIPVGNGTDALRVSLLAMGLKPGDEIITPTFTFVATAEVAASIGCTPVLVDIDENTFCMSPQSVENAITEKTKVIVPVQLFGQNCNMEALENIAQKHHIHIIEDACQSIGSEYIDKIGNKKQSGTIGECGCTSFFPSKNLGCYGDGGAIFTENDNLAKAMRSIANHGMTERYHYERIGINSRLDAIQAAILDVKLKHLNEYTQKRQKAALIYDQLLSSSQDIIRPYRASYSTHVFHQYTIKLPASRRDYIKMKLNESGIPAMIYYPIPLHLQRPYSDNRYTSDPFKNAEDACKTVLSIPMHTELDEEQQEYITKTILTNL